jgi:glucose-1-phosphate thymidylyltransferase
VYVLAKGVVVVPNSASWTGPWLGATRTASLQRVANRPIVCHVLSALADAGVEEAAIVAPAGVAAEISACVDAEGPPGIRVEHLVGDDLRGGSDALIAAVDFVGGAPAILHRGDGLLGAPILAAVEGDGAPLPDALLLVQPAAAEVRRLRLVADSDQPEDAQAPVGTAGACLLSAGVLERLPNQGCSAQLLDFAAMVEQVALDGGSTRVRVARGWRHFAGDARDLLDMNRAILDMLAAEPTAHPDDDNRFEGHIAIHPTARVTSSVIVGPVMIGADAHISDSYIGPHTSIAERVRIEGAELERSIVLADASVLHVGGRLVASIVGREARVFRDFSVPRALRLQVGDGDEVALC